MCQYFMLIVAYIKFDAMTHTLYDKLVGDYISTPSPNFVAMATRVGPTTFCMVPLNRPSPKTPW